MRTLTSLLALTSITISAACATARSASPAERLVGCYYFERDAAAEALRLPWGIRLMDEPLEGWPAVQQMEGVRRAATLHPEGDRDHPFGYWRPLASDSLEVGHPGGGGLVLDLHVAPDLAHLTGTATPVGDVPGVAEPGERAGPTPVRLMHARCPEE